MKRAAVYIVSLLLGFVVGFFFDACLGMVGFWFLEVSSLLYIVTTVNFFVSGQTHTMLGNVGAFTSGTTTLETWLTELVTDDPAWASTRP